MKKVFKKLLKLRPKSKLFRILIIVLFSLCVVGGTLVFTLFSCGSSCGGAQINMAVEAEDFEYTTVKDLLKQYEVSEEDLLKDISAYGEQDGFALYKRAYSNFLNTSDYRVVTTGYSKVDTMGGITVLVNNEKKFDGTHFYMHTLSLAEKDSIVSKMSNKNSMHYLYVSDDQKNNVATIKQLEPKDDSKVLSSLTCTEKNYSVRRL